MVRGDPGSLDGWAAGGRWELAFSAQRARVLGEGRLQHGGAFARGAALRRGRTGTRGAETGLFLHDASLVVFQPPPRRRRRF